MNQQAYPYMFPIQFGRPAETTLNRRVDVAFSVLRHLNDKQSPSIVPNSIGSAEQFEGQDLSIEERHLFVEACKFLVGFLKEPEPKDRTLIRCPRCQGGDMGCILCHGDGNVMIVPGGER